MGGSTLRRRSVGSFDRKNGSIMSELLSLLEAARLLGVDSAEVIRMIYREQLEGVVVEGHLKVPADQEPLKRQARGSCDPG
jgi:hypothetical protein